MNWEGRRIFQPQPTVQYSNWNGKLSAEDEGGIKKGRNAYYCALIVGNDKNWDCALL
jgi:hypothetical protein